MDYTTVNELNSVLKGEYMAVGAYDRFINEAGSDSVSNLLQEIRQDHKRHASELSRRIEGLGGEPVKSTGFAGLMASAKGTMEGMAGRDSIMLLENAYDGEDKGIAMAEEIIKGDLDPESEKLVKGILSEDHGHLKTLARMLGKLEEKK